MPGGWALEPLTHLCVHELGCRTKGGRTHHKPQQKSKGEQQTHPHIFCDSMVEGNHLYDRHGHVACLATDEVLDTITELEVAMAGESFVRPCAIQIMVDQRWHVVF